jgi:hypothetical protein
MLAILHLLVMFVADIFKSRPGLKPRTCFYVVNSTSL